MPVRAVTGFEHGLNNLTSLTKGNAGNKLFDTAAGSPSLVFGATRSGARGLELNPSAAVEAVGWSSNTFGSVNRALLAFAVRFPSALPSSDVTVALLEPTGSNAHLFFRNSDSKLVAAVDGTIGNGQAGPTLVADTWYWIELSYNTSTTTYTLDWWVDGVAQNQSAFNAGAVSNILGTYLGYPFSTQTMTAHYDDVLVYADTAAISAPIGPHKVVLLTPDTGGTTAEIGTANATGRMVTNSAIDSTHNSANILAATSEVPPLIGASASGVGQRTSGSGNAVGLPMTSYTLQAGESVSGLRILVVGWAASATANNIGLRVFNGTTERILFAAADPNFDNSTTSPAWLCKMATESPGAVTDFDTQAELDALVVRIGYSTDISPLPGAHAIYGELAIKEAAAGVALDGKAEVVVGMSGDVGMTWALESSAANAIVAATANLDLALALDGSANAIVETNTPTLDLALPLESSTANVVIEATGELSVGALVVLDGTAGLIVHAADALIDRILAFDGTANSIVEASGELSIVGLVALDGVGSLVLDLGVAELDVGGPVALDGLVDIVVYFPTTFLLVEGISPRQSVVRGRPRRVIRHPGWG